MFPLRRTLAGDFFEGKNDGVIRLAGGNINSFNLENINNERQMTSTESLRLMASLDRNQTLTGISCHIRGAWSPYSAQKEPW